jgi:hypothetical protein
MENFEKNLKKNMRAAVRKMNLKTIEEEKKQMKLM